MTGSSENSQFDELATAADAIDAEFLDAPEQPGGPPEPEPPQGPDIAELLTGLLMPAFAVLAPAWSITPQECKALADGWAPVIDKYFPDLSIGVELNAALITLAIIGPRIGKPAKPTAVRKESTQAEKPTSTAPPGFENESP